MDEAANQGFVKVATPMPSIQDRLTMKIMKKNL